MGELVTAFTGAVVGGLATGVLLAAFASMGALGILAAVAIPALVGVGLTVLGAHFENMHLQSFGIGGVVGSVLGGVILPGSEVLTNLIHK